MRVRIAAIADAHGNALALEATRAQIAAAAPDLVIDLGDRLSGPLQPAETADIFADLKPIGVRGNHDRQLATLEPGAMGASDRHAFEAISAGERAALGALPMQAAPCPGVLAFHARPDDDARYLHNRVEAGQLVDLPAREVAHPALTGLTLALCGHSHRPFAARLANGCVLVNPGSVGCPAYDDDDHVSESGLPLARWALIEIGPSGIERLDLNAVIYDHEAAARIAEANGRPEWAFALRTGRSPRAPRG
jgi:predicted phosphodiesterase